jgi:hypothetical protein
VFPNPASDEIRLSIPADWQNKQVIYELFSSDGRLVKKSMTAKSNQTETIDMSKLSSGLYTIKVTCEGKKAEQKIVKL